VFHVDLEDGTQILHFFSGNGAAAVRMARKQRSGIRVRAWASLILL
jgi:cyclopropane fatty-acyl-phospholipid synthase-like methyltransferase